MKEQTFQIVLKAAKHQASETNYKWSAGQIYLTDAEVEALAQMCEYGLGKRDKGKAIIDRRGNYRYWPDEKPQFIYKLKPDYENIVDSQTTHHVGRVKYISKEVLTKIWEHATGGACTTEEK